MRDIKYIAVHCTATSQNVKVETILKNWKAKGWKRPGYHYLIDKDGVIHTLHPEEQFSNGVKGYNMQTINVCYIGGLKVDDRTDAQKAIMLGLLKHLKGKYPNALIQGHRDFPNVNKACPRFNAKEEYNF
jgi:N-acetylmuramoyl-L-alanine amidase